MLKATLLLLIVFSSQIISSTNYENLEFETFDNTQGLISDVVNTIEKDAFGFMWYGTSQGLVRHDGYELRTFKDHPHLGKIYGVNVNDIATDIEGNMFICSAEGFFAFNSNYESIFTYAEEQLKGQTITSALRAKDGTIYLIANGNLHIINDVEKRVDTYKYSKPGVNRTCQVRCITEDHLGRIFIGGFNCDLLEFKKETKQFVEHRIILSGKQSLKSISSLYTDHSNNIWIGSWFNGVTIANISQNNTISYLAPKKEILTNERLLPGDVIFSINEDTNGSIWISTPYGLSVLTHPLQENSRIITYMAGEQKGDLSNSTILEIKQFDDNILWLSTKGGGVNKLHLNQNLFEHLKIPYVDKNKQSQTIYSFGRDPKDNLLIGVMSLGFYITDSTTQKLTHYSQSPEYKDLFNQFNINTVTAIKNYNDHTVIIGTRYQGVLIYDLQTKDAEAINPNTMQSNFRGRSLNCIHLLEDSAILLGTDYGLNIVRKKNNGWNSKIIHLTKNKRSFDVQSIVKYTEGRTIVATKNHGLYLITKDTNGEYRATAFEQFNNTILCVYNEKNENLWIGTKGNGLIRYNIESRKSEFPKIKGNNLGDIIYSINQDENDFIWFTSNIGLNKIKRNNKEYQAESYSHLDGLQGNIFFHNAFYKDNNGQFYIGGYNGYNRFNPTEIDTKNEKSKIVITEVKVEGRRIPYHYGQKNTITMQHNENNLSIKFSELSYVFSKANQYAYKIEGIDKAWHYVSSNERNANYNRLPHGDYVFRLKGSNSKGVWSNEETKLYLNIKQSPFKSLWAIILYFIASVGLVTLFFRQKLHNERMKQEIQLEQLRSSRADKLNQYKLGFFTNMSHELLTPLSILSSIVDEVERSQHFTSSTLSMMSRNINNLNRLIKQLLTFRKVETGNMKMHYSNENISEFLSLCANDFSVLSEKNNITYNIQINQNIKGKIDKEKIELIARNLLSNAFKYTPKDGNITFTLEPISAKNELLFKVEDSGCGISESEISKLFARFYRIQDHKKGTSDGVGIGLNLSKSLVSMMHGNIEVTSQQGKGSIFSVMIPLKESENQPEADLLFTEIEDKAKSKVEIIKTEEPETQSFNILLVEDNNDFRALLSKRLDENYKIFEACNGKEGFELAKRYDIDLILSDIMMPKMTGLELCLAIKEEPQTNHIPVVLLTAKVGDENRKEGYEAGADSFLEKPVDMTLLQIRIQSIIKQRQINRTAVTRITPKGSKPKTITPYDEKLFAKIQEIIDDNLSNVNFTVQELSEALSVSNSMLYRKVKNLVGISPSNFIRETRLKKATQMLENKSFTISEVAFNCGFNELSYFGQCFKKQYGVTPTAYQEGERSID